MNDPDPDSFIFHRGECELQTRYGSRALAAAQGPRVIRDHLNEQHRDFYPLLRQVYLGAADAHGALWATLRVGEPGFAHALDPRRLRIDAPAMLHDPLAAVFTPGVPLGLLGLDLTNRRRNRANGHVETSSATGFTLAIERAFGNCPQYIQTRMPGMPPAAPTASPVREATELDADTARMVAAADTFFIATQAREIAAGGLDVSHRGGKPGFVRIDDAHSLTVPDFAGNRLFMTLGNLQLDPRAGLLFVDFAQGDVLWLSGRALVVFEGPDLERFKGAERVLRYCIERARYAPGQLPQRWALHEYSPHLARTGEWGIDDSW
jgi:predicted pyridoxine 5'-phosphate oxidase superfamily flavin-nucleotide-binding protein